MNETAQDSEEFSAVSSRFDAVSGRKVKSFWANSIQKTENSPDQNFKKLGSLWPFFAPPAPRRPDFCRLASNRPVGRWGSNDRSVWHGSCTLCKNHAGPSGSLTPNYPPVGWGSNYRRVGLNPNYLRVGCRSNDRAHGSARRTIGQDGRSPSGCQHPSAPSTIHARSAPSGPLQVPCRSMWHGSCHGVKSDAATVPAPSVAGSMPINVAWFLC
jgi:hypothetical protein